MLDWLIAAQRWIYATLSADLTTFAATRDWSALLAVLPLGIAFGAVHALTPGHGKSVLASYLVGSRLEALRALAVAAVLALTHVGSAVLLALVAAPLVTRTLGGVGRAPALELVSRGILIAIGLWLIVRAWRPRDHPLEYPQERPHGRPQERPQERPLGRPHGEGLAVGFVAGLVPCPLTLFVMFFALARGVPEAGLIFAAAMSIGVGLTLSVVALLAILARGWVTRMAARHGASIDRIARLLDGAAGTLLVAIALHELRR